jgi:hypothetical protein
MPNNSVSVLGTTSRVEYARERTFLLEATALLIGPKAPEDRSETLVDEAGGCIPADGYAIWRRTGRAGTWRIAASAGVSERFGAEASVTLVAPVEPPEGTTVFGNIAAEPMLASQRASLQAQGIQSMLVVGLPIDGESSGGLVFNWRTRHEPASEEVNTAAALGRLAATAIATAELMERRTAKLDLVTVDSADDAIRVTGLKGAERTRAISIYSQLLRRKIENTLDPEELEFVHSVVRRTARMEALIRDLLSHMEASKDGEESSPPTDANEAVEAALSNLRASIGDSGARVWHSPPPRVTIRRVHDIMHSKTSLGTLLSNVASSRRKSGSLLRRGITSGCLRRGQRVPNRGEVQGANLWNIQASSYSR